MNVALIHKLLVALPAFTYEPIPESPEERSIRLMVVASAIFEASDGQRLMAGMLMKQGQAESNYAKYVHDGNCLAGPEGMRCDNGKAKTPWQLHKYGCAIKVWELEDGSEEQIHEAAVCTAKLFKFHQYRCRNMHADDLVGAFGGMSGSSCGGEPWTWERARGAREFAKELKAP